MHIIRSATFKLTLWYLAIIMLISAIFSMALYNVSYGQIADNADHQRQAIERIPLPPELEARRTQFEQQLDDELAAAQSQLLLRLFTLSGGMLLFGAAASYLLARRSLRPIEEVMEAQGRFTGDASHELRTPLTAMRTEIEVALRDKDLAAADARELLASNLEEIAKLEALSAGLLRLARSDNGLDPAALAHSRAADIFNDAAERFAPIIADHDLTLDITAGTTSLTGDRDGLVELIAILLDNAIKYSPEHTRITLAAAPAGSGHVRLSVSDEGGGIKASDLPHIFDRFYRADQSRTRAAVGGYGLGLSIAKRIVDLHHGSISVDSKPDKGTIFTVRLPSRQALPGSHIASASGSFGPFAPIQSLIERIIRRAASRLSSPRDPKSPINRDVISSPPSQQSSPESAAQYQDVVWPHCNT